MYTDIHQEGKGQTAHTIERQAVTANPREKGTNMIQALLPDPFNPAVNVGDVIAFLAFYAAAIIAIKKGERNGR